MALKKCSKCNTDKEATAENFHNERLSPDGLRSDCRECRNAYRRGFRLTHDMKDSEYDLKKDLRVKHGVTLQWVEEKLKEQSGHCALCETVDDGNRRLNIDHDHSCCSGRNNCSKCNRGLLCNSCNQRIGYLEAVLKDALVFPMLGKDQSWTGRALRYLIDWEYKHKRI